MNSNDFINDWVTAGNAGIVKMTNGEEVTGTILGAVSIPNMIESEEISRLFVNRFGSGVVELNLNNIVKFSDTDRDCSVYLK